jgi:hypothetical protein
MHVWQSVRAVQYTTREVSYGDAEALHAVRLTAHVWEHARIWTFEEQLHPASWLPCSRPHRPHRSPPQLDLIATPTAALEVRTELHVSIVLVTDSGSSSTTRIERRGQFHIISHQPDSTSPSGLHLRRTIAVARCPEYSDHEYSSPMPCVTSQGCLSHYIIRVSDGYCI